MTNANTNTGKLNPLFHPAADHESPDDVLNDSELSVPEKRIILSSWASDMFAVESCQTLREIPGMGCTIRLADILAALRQLDGDDIHLAGVASRCGCGGLLGPPRSGAAADAYANRSGAGVDYRDAGQGQSAQPAGRQAHASTLGRASRGCVSEGSANDSMTDVTQLIPGRFYWVLVRSSTKNPEWQPARFTGVACQSACAKWDFIGFNSDVGHHFVEVVDIGPELRSKRS